MLTENKKAGIVEKWKCFREFMSEEQGNLTAEVTLASSSMVLPKGLSV